MGNSTLRLTFKASRQFFDDGSGSVTIRWVEKDIDPVQINFGEDYAFYIRCR